MMVTASYLPVVSGTERDPSQFVPELSRRARGFATWAMLRHLGRSGIASMIERHCKQARFFASLLRSEPGVAVVNDVVLNQVIVRFGADEPDEAGDAHTRNTITRLQQDGTCFAGGAQWKGRWVMRLSITNAATSDEDIRLSAEAILRCWREMRLDNEQRD